MRQVESCHHDRDAGPEHHGRGVGVDVEIELGRRGDVAEGERPAHQHDPPDAVADVRREAERQRDVGEWAERTERHGRGRGPQLGDDELHRVAAAGLSARRGEPGAREAVGAADELRRFERQHQRALGAPVDGNVRAAGELAHAQGVRRRLRDRDVARDRRDAAEIEPFARGERQQDRDGVVVARVGVDDDRLGHVGGSRVGGSAFALEGLEGVGFG
jgi:hypothetical protein